MWNSLFRKRWPIAIDIGADSVKLLQLSRMGGTLGVSACGRCRYPEAVRNDPSQREKSAIGAVREMLKKKTFRGRSVVSALSCDQLSIKSIRLPSLPEEQLAGAVQQEARDRLGFEAPPGQLSYLNAGQVRQGTETRDEIILLAAAREQVEQHLDLLNQMGLEAEHIDAQPVALFRSQERLLRRQADAQTVSVLADLGLGATRVVVARGRQILFIKSIDIGGQNFTQAVAKQLHLIPEEAEELRMRIAREHLEGLGARPQEGQAQAPGDANSLAWTVRDAVRAEVEALAKELNLCLRYCAVTFRGMRADRVTLTGGEAYDPAVTEIFQEHLKLQCVLGQPFKGMDVSGVQFGGDRRGTLAEWSICAGLALRYVQDKESPQETEHGDREHRLSA